MCPADGLLYWFVFVLPDLLPCLLPFTVANGMTSNISPFPEYNHFFPFPDANIRILSHSVFS
jgi:hypothetical protein